MSNARQGLGVRIRCRQISESVMRSCAMMNVNELRGIDVEADSSCLDLAPSELAADLSALGNLSPHIQGNLVHFIIALEAEDNIPFLAR
jgi:hypothetical protein